MRDDWQTKRSHICIQINREEQLGSEIDRTTQVSWGRGGNKTSKPLTIKICGGYNGRRNFQSHRRVGWRDP